MKWYEWLGLAATILFVANYVWRLRPEWPSRWEEALEFQKSYVVCKMRPTECGVWSACIRVWDGNKRSTPFNILAPPEEIPNLDVNDVVWADRNGSGKPIFRVRKKLKTSILD